ncbi:Small integral membrane protein 14 [Anthophora plagiata]
MADEAFDSCECIWNHELAMKLLSILRQSQSYCTDSECLSMSRLPLSHETSSSSNFLLTCLIIAFAVIMYVLRPNSLRRTRTNTVKDQNNERDSNGDNPPAPPPTAQ